MWIPFLRRKRIIEEEVAVRKDQMNEAARHSEQNKERLKEAIEQNGITLYIVRAMGGKHDGH